jgi:hypothetical protein
VYTANGEHDEFQPFVWGIGLGKSLDISFWDREEGGFNSVVVESAVVESDMDFRLYHFTSQEQVQVMDNLVTRATSGKDRSSTSVEMYDVTRVHSTVTTWERIFLALSVATCYLKASRMYTCTLKGHQDNVAHSPTVQPRLRRVHCVTDHSVVIDRPKLVGLNLLTTVAAVIAQLLAFKIHSCPSYPQPETPCRRMAGRLPAYHFSRGAYPLS